MHSTTLPGRTTVTSAHERPPTETRGGTRLPKSTPSTRTRSPPRRMQLKVSARVAATRPAARDAGEGEGGVPSAVWLGASAPSSLALVWFHATAASCVEKYWSYVPSPPQPVTRVMSGAGGKGGG